MNKTTKIGADEISLNGDVFAPKVETYGPGVTLTDGRREFVVFASREDACAAARERWADMAENDPKEFACIVGEECLVAWALGHSGGHAGCSSLTEFLDLIETVPAEEFASYDGNEIDRIECGADLAEEIGFVPAVAYRHN
jgi:methylthioribose-1-phosphate isomerase